MRELTKAQKQVCKLVGEGWTQNDASKEAGVTYQTVSDWYRDLNGLGEAMAYWTRHYTDQYLAQVYPSAVKVANRILSEESSDVAVKAADLLLKRQAWIEKREAEREKLRLERERFEESKRQASLDLGGSASGLQRIVIPEDSVLEATGETPPSSARPPREAG